MIRINSRGDFCHGVGGGYFNVNNVAICPGAALGWMTDDAIAFAGPDASLPGEFVAQQYGPAGQLKVFDPPSGANHGYAGGGHASWWWGHAGGGLFSTTGFRSPEAGLLGMGPDGAIGYKPSYQSNGPTMVRELDGSEWMLTPNHAYDLQLLGNRRAMWTDTVMGPSVVGIPVPQTVPGGGWFRQAFQIGGEWWIGYQTSFGTIAHPFNDPSHGYQFVGSGVDNWPTFRALNDHDLLCVYAISEAEQAGQCFPVHVNPQTAPRMAFIAQPVPTPTPTPPTKENPPVPTPIYTANPTDALKALRSLYPTPLGGDHASFLIAACKVVGHEAGLLAKSGGSVVTLPDGQTVSQDWMVFPDGFGTDFLTDGEGAANVGWGQLQEYDKTRYVDISGIIVGEPGPTPKPDPKPLPGPSQPDLGPILAQLEVLSRDVADLASRIAQLEAKPDPTYEVRIGRSYGHSHSASIKKVG